MGGNQKLSKIRLTEQFTLSALHHLENELLSEEENKKLFGICFRKHGHDYQIQVEIEAEINEATGLAFDRERLEMVISKSVKDKFEGRFLNEHFDCTSGEALSYYFFKLLELPIRKELAGAHLYALHIQETRKNWFSYSKE